MYGNHQLDHLDKKIIHLLSKDGRRPFTEIAEELNVTEKTIRTRFKNLSENEILNVTGVVNPVAIGIKAGAIILVKVQLSHLDQVIEEVKKVKEVRFISLISGPYQLIIQINVPEQEDLTESLKRIKKIDGMIEMNSLIQLEVYKNTFEYF